MAAVGLAQNFSALRALVTEGIQAGHMTLHARTVVKAAGTPPELFDQVLERLIGEGDVKVWRARGRSWANWKESAACRRWTKRRWRAWAWPGAS